ncbi:MAG: RNA polymerase sigma factor (sigma-70 family) [Candidatus Latescibacterota bacterium]|jgi:RNA polymerase sigma factor (sigma-70 family)
MPMSFDDHLAKSYLQTLKRYSPLPQIELNNLIHKAHAGDRNAFNKVIQTNLRFVITVAATFRNTKLAFDELVAEGNLGLMHAVEKFDPDRGYKFTTYAVWWIRQAMQRAIRQDTLPFHRPLNHFEDWDCIRRQIDRLSQKTGQTPAISDIADTLALTPQRLKAAYDTQFKITGLDAPVTNNGPTVSESFAAKQPDPHQILETKESTESIQGALAMLPPRDAEIIALTFGLKEEMLSYSKVGKRLGISKERVRQLRNRALTQLRTKLRHFGSPEETSLQNAVALSA